MQRLNSLQALRGFAALGVVLVHTTHDAAAYLGRPIVEAIGERGAAGVDVFFVLSGFVMVATTDARPTTPVAFLWNRIARVMPLYWLATFLEVALAHFSRGMPQPNASDILTSLAFVPHFDATGQIATVLHVGWTLNYEMFFYLLFAAAMVWGKGRVLVLCTTISGLTLLGAILKPQSSFGVTWTGPIMLEFCLGCVAARVWRAGARVSLPIAVTAGFIAVGAISVAPAITQVSGDLRPILWGAPAFVLIVATACCPALERWAKWLPLQALGNASYSIYLVHTSVLIVLGRVWAIAGMPPLIVLLATPVALSIAAGLASHRLIERPVTNGLRLLAGHRKHVTVPL